MQTVNALLRYSLFVKQQAGFTYNEILISISLIAVGVLGLSLNTIGVIRGNHMSGNYTVATNLAQDKIEELRTSTPLLNVNFCPDSGDRHITAAGAAGGIYHRCWTVSDSPLGAELKQIDVIVSWQDYTPRQVKMTTLLFSG